MSRYLICGSRTWTDPIIDTFVYGLGFWGKMFREKYTVITGGAKGADERAKAAAEDVASLEVETYYPEYNKFGRGAPLKRNQRMLDEGKPKVVIAFSNEFDGHSGRGGTEDMCRRAVKAGLLVYLVKRLTVDDFS